MIALGLRALAVLIAVAGVIDPSIGLQRRVPPIVELHVGAGAVAAASAAAVEEWLQDRFTVLPAPVAGASARVVVGDVLPPAADIPAFVVRGDDTEGGAIIEVSAAARAPLHGRVPVRVVLRPETMAGAEVALQVDGLVADRRRVADLPRRTDGAVVATLAFTPTGVQPHHVRVVAGAAHADLLVGIDDAPWRVLVFDARPSWASTFVRRALERDVRFALAAHVDTAPSSAVSSGSPPLLADLEALADVDVIILGAPDAVDAAAVEALERFMRRRGGSVVVLIDGAVGAVAGLAGVERWNERLQPASAPLIDGAGDGWLRASELVVPASLPAAARLIAGIDETAGLEPVIWQLAVGRGRLVVSGALDAWRFRDSGAARFDDFWRRLVADAAVAAPPAIELRPEPRVGRPGEAVVVDVTLRDVALAGEAEAEARVTARLVGAGAEVPVRLWPGLAGRFRGRLRLPQATGPYRLIVESDGAAAESDVRVVADAARPLPIDGFLLDAWASAHGGEVFSTARLRELEAALEASIVPQSITVEMHPMRSGWWMLPFTLALAGEWWLRRRHGRR